MDCVYDQQHSGCEHLQRLISCAAASVMLKLKPAELISLRGREFNCAACYDEIGAQLFEKLQLSKCEIRRNGSNLLVMAYDPQLLSAALTKQGAAAILEGCGYPHGITLTAMLTRLRERFTRDDFPHEVGLFLGYPAHDVEGFVAMMGKGYKLSRYWKVYGDIEGAKRSFQKLDSVRQRASQLFNSQLPLEQAIAELKAV